MTHTPDAPNPPVPLATELQIHAYVDGELPREQVPAIEERLRCDAASRVLATALDVQRTALQAHFPLPDDCPRTRALAEYVLSYGARAR